MAHRFAARPLLALAISMACGTAPLYLQAAETTQAQTYRFDIPGQSLDGALAAFSAVTRVQVLVSGELTQQVISPGVKGSLGQREALGQLLGGTGLSAAFINADTVTLEKRVASGSAIEVGATTISAERLGATTEGSGSYTTGAVTLGKGEQKLKDIPQSVSVMSAKFSRNATISYLQGVESIHDQHKPTAASLFRGVPAG